MIDDFSIFPTVYNGIKDSNKEEDYMDMFKEAEAIDGMIKMFSLSQNECAKRLGTSQSYVANKLRLLKLGGKIREEILKRGLSERHARLILKLKREDLRLIAIEKIASMRLNVLASEAIISSLIEEERKADKNTCIQKESTVERFRRVLEEYVARLQSEGIYADIKTSYEGHKEYITVVIGRY